MQSELSEPEIMRTQQIGRVLLQQNALEIIFLLDKFGPLKHRDLRKAIQTAKLDTDQLEVTLSCLEDVGLLTIEKAKGYILSTKRYILSKEGKEYAVRFQSYIDAIKVGKTIEAKHR